MSVLLTDREARALSRYLEWSGGPDLRPSFDVLVRPHLMGPENSLSEAEADDLLKKLGWFSRYYRGRRR